MLRFSTIDEKLDIYRKRRVILFGAGRNGRLMLGRFLGMGINPFAFCDNDREKQGTKVEGCEVLSPEALKGMDDFIVQITAEKDREIRQQLEAMGIDDFVTMAEFNQRIYDLSKHTLLNTPQKRENYYRQKGILDVVKTRNEWPLWDYLCWSSFMGDEELLVLCLPPKTGDWTLNATLSFYGKSYVNFWHSYRHMTSMAKEALGNRRLKIVAAVRDPIAQNISIFFNMSDAFWDEPEYFKNGGDVQLLFDAWMMNELGDSMNAVSPLPEIEKIDFRYYNALKKAEGVDYIIQEWFGKQFCPYSGIDVYDYPFNREAGYSIISTEEADVFIYQLEKINEISGALGDFLGISDMQLINDNESENKWYARAYKKALRELKLKKDYLDTIYSSELVRHFYSEDDIRRFSKRWEENAC